MSGVVSPYSNFAFSVVLVFNKFIQYSKVCNNQFLHTIHVCNA